MFNIIDNRGPNNMRDFLDERLLRASRVDVAVAFITRAGLDKLLIRLRGVSKRGHVRVLTGLYEWFTEPEALDHLLSAASTTFEVAISRRRKFHPKLWILHGRSTLCVVGSSNLTVEGLVAEGEANLIVSNEGQIVQKYFDAEWAESVPLTGDIIQRYRAARKPIGRRPTPPVPISAILNTSATRKFEVLQETARRFWADALIGFASKKTQAIISEATSWDRRGLSWYSTGRNATKKGDRICLYDYSGAISYLRIVEVVEKTEIQPSTDDGRYFIAYRIVKGTARRTITPERRQALRALAVYIPRNDPRWFSISNDKWLALNRFLGSS